VPRRPVPRAQTLSSVRIAAGSAIVATSSSAISSAAGFRAAAVSAAAIEESGFQSLVRRAPAAWSCNVAAATSPNRSRIVLQSIQRNREPASVPRGAGGIQDRQRILEAWATPTTSAASHRAGSDHGRDPLRQADCPRGA
jgi:hypothetical protein